MLLLCYHRFLSKIFILFLNLQVILAKEAGLCYAAMGLVTDYDSWREDTEGVGFLALG